MAITRWELVWVYPWLGALVPKALQAVANQALKSLQRGKIQGAAVFNRVSRNSPSA
jgi:hypothetical protein